MKLNAPYVVRFVKPFLLQLSALLFIPLLGWALGNHAQPILSQLGNDLALFFENPVRFAYAVLTVAVAAGRGAIIARLRPPSVGYSTQSELQHWRNIAFESILVLAPFSDRRNLLVWGESPALSWMGVALFLVGMAWNLYAVATFLHHERDRQPPPAVPLLLCSGPFRLVRYPVHLAMLVYSLGIALLFRSWIGLFMLVFMFLYINLRIREEEKRNRITYGIQWAAYIKRSWRLIPYIY